MSIQYRYVLLSSISNLIPANQSVFSRFIFSLFGLMTWVGTYNIFKLFYECTCLNRATHECIPDTLTIIATSFRSFCHPAIFHTFVAPWPQNDESISGQPVACRSTRTSPVALQGVPRVQHPPFFSRRCNSLLCTGFSHMSYFSAFCF